METETIKLGKYKYIEAGEGQPVILLHGLMGGLSNYAETVKMLSENGYRAIVPSLPLYSLPILKATVTGLAKFLNSFIKKLEIENPILLGNSLGGHVALVYAEKKQGNIKGLVLTGSSGLYENIGHSYPKRGNYEYITEKTREVFYNPAIATKELVDEMFAIVNNRIKVIHTIAISRSAMRHNMEAELPKIKTKTCLIWGRNDIVTPPEVAEQFHRLLPDSELHWIERCGHAPMMERPEEFNALLLGWLKRNNL